MNAIDLGAIDPRLLADGALVLLAAGLAFYVAALARRLGAARKDLAQVQAALIELAKIVGQSNRAGGGPAAEPARDELRDDLAFLVERGAALADRLEQDLRLGLVRQRHAASGGAAQGTAPDGAGRVVSLPELKLIKSLTPPR
jgi:hypothetical protein